MQNSSGFICAISQFINSIYAGQTLEGVQVLAIRTDTHVGIVIARGNQLLRAVFLTVRRTEKCLRRNRVIEINSFCNVKSIKPRLIYEN